MPISVVVALIKRQSNEKNCATTNFDLTINFDFFDLINWNRSWYQRQTWFVDVSYT